LIPSSFSTDPFAQDVTPAIGTPGALMMMPGTLGIAATVRALSKTSRGFMATEAAFLDI
jgi:hypothetical protein